MQNAETTNKRIITVENENWTHYQVKSDSLLSKEIIFIMNYPGEYIPVVDNEELTGMINKEKIKKIPVNKLDKILVQQIKEDAPYIALETSCEKTLKREMHKKRIENVFIIDQQFKFKGTYSVQLIKSKHKSKNVFEHLFNISLDEAKAA